MASYGLQRLKELLRDSDGLLQAMAVGRHLLQGIQRGQAHARVVIRFRYLRKPWQPLLGSRSGHLDPRTALAHPVFLRNLSS